MCVGGVVWDIGELMMENKANMDKILVLISNYRTLAKQIVVALERNTGMSADEVRDLAVASYTILDNINALTTDDVKIHWLDPRPACHNTAVCGGRYTKIKTEHIEFVTCGKCQRSILFKEVMERVKNERQND